jgi:hypothetical protein
MVKSLHRVLQPGGLNSAVRAVFCPATMVFIPPWLRINSTRLPTGCVGICAI